MAIDFGGALSIALWAVPVLVTVALGVLALRKRARGRVVVVGQTTIGLLDSVAETMPELVVTYNGRPVPGNIVFVRWYVVNVGDLDITSEMTDRPITFTLDERFRWLNARVSHKSPGLTGRLDRQLQTIEVHTKLLRSNEFVCLECLACPAETDPTDSTCGPQGPLVDSTPRDIVFDFLGAISVDHRIANTAKGGFVPLWDITLSSRERFWEFARPVAGGVFALIAVLLAIGLLLFTTDLRLHHYVEVSEGPAEACVVRIRGQDTVRVVSAESSFAAGMSFKEFEEKRTGEVTLRKDPLTAWLHWILIGLVVLLIVASAGGSWEIRRVITRNRLRRVLSFATSQPPRPEAD